MHEYTFVAMGTTWVLSSDGTPFKKEDIAVILEETETFEAQFSRFRSGSEANAFANAMAGTYTISDEFAVLLKESDMLRSLTDGRYDPAVGALLEHAGYDEAYSFCPKESVREFQLPKWSLDGAALTIDQPAIFDIGGTGKGYWIDRIADRLREQGYEHIAVDGGGDMYVTTKRDGSSWNVAIQYPGKSDTAAGIVRLQHEALAVSDTFRRRWKNWHHIVDPKDRAPVEHTIGAASVAPNAWHADCVTSAVFLAPPSACAHIAHHYHAQYLAFLDDEKCIKSDGWSGELF